eukprot:c22313_g1_i2 orf=189-443(+)
MHYIVTPWARPRTCSHSPPSNICPDHHQSSFVKGARVDSQPSVVSAYFGITEFSILSVFLLRTCLLLLSPLCIIFLHNMHQQNT